MSRRPWLEILHEIRQREIALIFGGCPPACFREGLELGAGDGYQSHHLARYVQMLVSTDYNRRRLAPSRESGIHYLVCDAQAVDRTFKPGTFDLVFSSNLLEHLPHPDLALRGISTVLQEGGISIHVMPNPLMKLMWMLFFYPQQVRLLAGAATSVIGRRTQPLHQDPQTAAAGELSWNNNPHRKPNGYLRRHVWPIPHGAYGSNVEEFFQYRLARWVGLLEREGFEVLRVLKMPFTTGYGFGLEGLRALCERAGLATGYAYVASKANAKSPLREYWLPRM